MADPSELVALDLERRVGHPGELWADLQQRIQADAITRFARVGHDWLRLMWSIDAFRVAGVPPRGMGRKDLDPGPRLAAIYRMKGNWFATLVALLLQNTTHERIQPRTKVQGFSQMHQIDVAWPVREEDPLVCAETKVTGAPAYGRTPVRRATADFSNRRKELKFAATDLKLYRRQQETFIKHWGVWRENAPPKTYFLWAARLKTEGRRGNDNIEKLIAEATALSTSYLDGTGVMAWQANRSADGYEQVQLPASARVSDLDDVLYRIASEITLALGPSGHAPPPVIPGERAVAVHELMADYDEDVT